MRLTQIRDFVAVVDAGSISSAARLLNVSQPGLTKSIGRLEAELAVSLLQRTPRGVSLTRYGRAFFSARPRGPFRARQGAAGTGPAGGRT